MCFGNLWPQCVWKSTVTLFSWGIHALKDWCTWDKWFAGLMTQLHFLFVSEKFARCFHELSRLSKCVLEFQPPMHSPHTQACEIGVDTAGVCTDHTSSHTSHPYTMSAPCTTASWMKLGSNCLEFSFLFDIILVTHAASASQEFSLNTKTQAWVADLTFKLSLKHARGS